MSKLLSKFAFLLALLFLSVSCTNPCHNYCVEGAEEFVIDSYKIRQGKLSILEMEGVCIAEITDEDLEEFVDTIADGDVLNIAIYHPTRKDLEEAVRTIAVSVGFKVSKGKINLPDLDPIAVENLTLEEARDKIQAAYRQEIKDIEIFISYRDRLKRNVELTGLVSQTYIPVDGTTRLFEIIALARVPPTANFFKSYVVREGQQLGVDLHKLLQEGDMSQNIVMQGGDKIYIASPEDGRAVVMGEVMHPTPIALPRGYLSLREALVLAGGIPYTGNRNCIQVIRGNIVCPKIYILNWKHIVNLPNDSLLLMPGDIVYISEKPITEWNRFISQLFPSFSGLQMGYGAYEIFLP